MYAKEWSWDTNSGQNLQMERLSGYQGFLATAQQMSMTSVVSDQGMSTGNKSLYPHLRAGIGLLLLRGSLCTFLRVLPNLMHLTVYCMLWLPHPGHVHQIVYRYPPQGRLQEMIRASLSFYLSIFLGYNKRIDCLKDYTH